MAETIDIDIMGETITVPRWASEETLAKLVNSLEKGTGGLGKSLKDARDGLGTPTGRGFTGTIKKTTTETDKLKASISKGEAAMKGLQSVVVGAGGLVGSLSQSTGRFSDLNTVTGIMIDAFTSLTSAIPLAGRALDAFGDVAKVIIELNNAILDDTLDSFYTLSQSGFGLQNDLLELAASAREGNLTLEQLTQGVMSAQQGVLVLGSSFDQGVRRFTMIQAMLRDENGEFAKALKGFGYGATETAEFLADFLQDQRTSLAIRNMSEQELASRSFQYAKNLRIISEFTGQEVDEMRKRQQQIATDGAFQSKLQQMRLNNMSNEARAIEEVIAALPTEAARETAKQIFTFGNAVTEQGALFNMIAPDFQTNVEQLFADVMAKGEFAIEDNASYASTVKAIADIATNATNLQIGTFAMLDQSSTLSKLIESVITDAASLHAILGEGGTVKDAVDGLGEIVQDQNDQIDGINISEFNDKLITLATDLESVGPDIQKAILDNIEDLTDLQLSAAQGLVDLISKTTDLLKDASATNMEKAMVNPNSPHHPEFKKSFAGFSNYLYSPLFGAGEGGIGFDTGLLDSFTDMDKNVTPGVTGLISESLPRKMKDKYNKIVSDLSSAFNFLSGSKASGGRVGGGLYMVGERGPELLRMNPGSSGHVYSNAVSTAMATPRYAGGPVMGDMDIGSTASTTTAETQESSALPSMQKGAYTGTSNFANELTNGLRPIANVEMEMKAMRRDIKNLMTKVLTANGHF